MNKMGVESVAQKVVRREIESSLRSGLLRSPSFLLILLIMSNSTFPFSLAVAYVHHNLVRRCLVATYLHSTYENIPTLRGGIGIARPIRVITFTGFHSARGTTKLG
jgi:hypothetical protein